MDIAAGRLKIQESLPLRGRVCGRGLEVEDMDGAEGDGLATTARTRRAIWRDGAWVCVEDPSGEFRGGQFGEYELRDTARLKFWPEGVRFKNIRNGEVMEVVDGKLRKKRTSNEGGAK